MLSWFLKKRGTEVPIAAAPSTRAASPPAEPAPPIEPQAEAARLEWQARLQAARGDDASLLQLVQEAPLLEIKLAAVEAIVTEDVLKRAERVLRDRERKAHQAAKRRLLAAVARRESRAKAQALIADAGALSTEPVLAANRLVALDRAWQALDAALLEPGQCAAFADLRERLNATLREHGEQERRLQRWTLDATQALNELRATCVQAAATGVARDTATACEAVRARRASRPDVPATAALDQALAAALDTAASVELRLAWLQAPELRVVKPESQVQSESGSEVDTDADVEAEADAEVEVEAEAEIEARKAGPATPAASTVPRWQDLPPLPDAELARTLDQRFEQSRQAPVPSPAPSAVVPKRAARVAPQAVSAEQRQHLSALVQTAETALAEGQLAGMQRHLNAVDAALAALHGATLGDVLQTRLQALQGERARLKGWQQWGGARARDELMTEADALAQRALAAAGTQAQPGAIASTPAVASAPVPRGRTVKLHLKTHADAINALRARWKALDRAGAPAGQALWQRFDAALHTAWQPVAAQQAAQKAARRDNLTAREALLAVLDAVPVEAPDASDAAALAAHWKEQARALEQFQLAWRQLGPLEHSVPPAARGALQQRLRVSVDRIEVPLRAARDAAHGGREQLIRRAEALAPSSGSAPPARDAALRVRELQAEWRQQARAVPLARAAEGLLWARFRAATDAVFAQRKAALGAREAELAANLAVREALVQRLLDIDGGLPEAEIKRRLAEADREWREGVDVPRGAVAGIEARFRAARDAALQRLRGHEESRWQAHCDVLEARLADGTEVELTLADGGADAGAGADGRANAGARSNVSPVSRNSEPESRDTNLRAPALDDLLLQLETALDVPVAPEWQAARRDLKLRVLKDTLEGRKPQPADATPPAEWLAAALRQTVRSDVQRERLRAVIAALRQAPPGALRLLAPRDA